MNILLIYDVDGWAWHHMASDIIKYAPERYNVKAVRSDQVTTDVRAWAEAMFYLSWFESDTRVAEQGKRLTCQLASHGCEFDQWRNSYPNDNYWPAVTASGMRCRKNAEQRFPKITHGILCTNPRLRDFARKHNDKAVYIPIGVDCDRFKELPPSYGGTQKLKVGWCGHATPGTPNPKGYDWVLAPVMERCGDFCEFIINNRSSQDALSRDAMVEWYKGIDVLLCTSINEGMPFPILEAMASGRPVVTTNIGDVAELMDNGSGGFICKAYTDSVDVKVTIENIANNLERTSERWVYNLMAENASVIASGVRHWKDLAPKWLDFIAGKV